jgi:hypothetical protein
MEVNNIVFETKTPPKTPLHIGGALDYPKNKNFTSLYFSYYKKEEYISYFFILINT